MNQFQNAAEELEKEYQIFLDYIETNEVMISKATGHFGKKDCFELNSRFHIVKERYKKAGRTQEYYTVIDFFVFFSVYLDILRLVSKKGVGLIYEKGEKYSSFYELYPIEKYALMMWVWLGGYEDAFRNFSFSAVSSEFYEKLRKTKVNEPVTYSYVKDPQIWGKFYSPQLRLCALFRLITIEWLDKGPVDPENKFLVNAIYKTEEGACLTALMDEIDEDFWNYPDDDSLSDLIFEIIPEEMTDTDLKFQRILEKSAEPGEHSIEFQIRVGSAVREIKTGDQHTLEDLHYEILKSVDFDSDHLYYFQFGSGTLRQKYYAPECRDMELTADEVVLAELTLYEGLSFEFIYDFGDSWHFHVMVKRIIPGHMEGSEMTVVKGANPEQYPSYDEEEW